MTGKILNRNRRDLTTMIFLENVICYIIASSAYIVVNQVCCHALSLHALRIYYPVSDKVSWNIKSKGRLKHGEIAELAVLRPKVLLRRWHWRRSKTATGTRVINVYRSTVEPRKNQEPRNCVRFFDEVSLFIYYTIAGVKKIIPYTEDLYIM